MKGYDKFAPAFDERREKRSTHLFEDGGSYTGE